MARDPAGAPANAVRACPRAQGRDYYSLDRIEYQENRSESAGTPHGTGKAKRNRSISIRVPIADLEQAQQIAERTGVGYQAVLKQAIRKGLKRAG